MYIIYKIINNIICFFWNQNKVIVLLKYNEIQYSHLGFNFDFTDSTTHLGDRLFFFPLIRALYDRKIPIMITDNGLTERLFYSVYGIHLKSSKSGNYVNVIPKSSFLRFKKKYHNLLVCDFTDLRVENKISVELIKSFNLLFSFNLAYNTVSDYRSPIFFDYLALAKNFKYIIFNNYVNSGFFRIYFVNKNRLNQKCISLKKLGYKVIHVGSLQDKKSDQEIYDFVDVDLRGLLSVEELVSLLDSPNVLEIVTFDNFIMHIGHMFNKTTWVLFRGRFSKSHYQHHINFVNNTFSNKGLVNYL